MSLQNLNSSEPIDLEQIVTILLPDIYDAVRWACLRYQRRIRQDELDDLSQLIVIMLTENDCRLLRSFKHQSSFKTWLQAIVNHHVYKYLHRRKQTESLDEVDQRALIYSPTQDQDIYTEEKQKLLLRALDKLSQQERLLYHLWFEVELDPAEIAAVFVTQVKIIYKRKQTLELKLRRLVRDYQSHYSGFQ